MSKQQELHTQASRLIATLEGIIDQLKIAGPCSFDGDNALANIREKLDGIVRGRIWRI